MKPTKMLTILVLALGLMVWSAPAASGGQSLTVNGGAAEAVILKVGQSCTVEVVSDDSNPYTAYVGFDNGVVLGTFSYQEKKLEAGNLASATVYNVPAFSGYFIVAAGSAPPPSAGVHFVFQYQAQVLGETDLQLYDSIFSLVDSVHITVVHAEMGTGFTYQGSLNDAGSPADGLYDFEFVLYDAPSDGNQLGSTIDINDLDVIDGQFAIALDFGSDAFDGSAVWLETMVAHGDGNDPCTLTPRVELTPTPYALYAASVGVPLELSGSSPDPIISATNSGFGHGVYVKVTHPSDCENYAGYFEAAGSDSGGVYGLATGRWGMGVTGETMGRTGRGVYGLATATTTGIYINYGGHFESRGSSGRGVYGVASKSGNYTNYGGYFEAAGSYGRGVYGEAAGSSGRGVYGVASATGEVQNYGGYFSAAGESGRGVYGLATGGAGRAVYGEASNTGDVMNHGGYFVARGEQGRGVYGFASGSSGQAVRGLATGPYGEGVRGEASSSNSKGVVGHGGSSGGTGYDFYADGPGINYGVASSIRWKSDIRPIDEPLEKIMSLRGVYFNWDAEHGGHHDVGMIAEEVGEVLPEIVGYEEDGKYTSGMDYSKLTPLLVEAVKELKGENDRLKERVEALERTIHQLAKVKELEL